MKVEYVGFGVLDRHGIDWRYYESDVSMIRMFDRYRLNDDKVLAIDDPDSFCRALVGKMKNGRGPVASNSTSSWDRIGDGLETRYPVGL